MGLKRFDYKLPGQRKNFKQIAIVLCICLIAVLSFTSYALYEVRHPNDFVDSKVGEFSTSDVSITVLVDGVKANAFPTKDSGKSFLGLSCTNGGSASWDKVNWKLSIKDISGPTECTVSFGTAENAVEKLTELVKTNTTEMFIDDTTDANIRYMGADPANYVDIGNGNDADGNPILWRIIGVMNNVDDGTGKKETRIKVVRETSIGQIAWDYKCMGTYDKTAGICSTATYKNNWETASLNKTLNEAFYNSAKTTDPNYANINGSAKWQQLDYSTIGLGNMDKNLIGNVVYYLGGPSESDNLTTLEYYEIERSETKYSTNPATWTGKVGLMYPSDYGYATSGGIEKDKSACAAKQLYYWDSSTYADCKDNDWLLNPNNYGQNTITPGSYWNSGIVSVATSSGLVNYTRGSTAKAACWTHPTLYLKSDVKIIGGDGTKGYPYKLVA